MRPTIPQTLIFLLSLAVVTPARATPCADAPPGGICPEADIERERENENENENESEVVVAPEMLDSLGEHPDPAVMLLRSGLTCKRDELAAIEKRGLASSMVDVEGQFGFARGLIVDGGRYVITRFSPVSRGRGFIISRGDQRLSWRAVVATDREHDLALVELAVVAKRAETSFSTQPLVAGDPIVLLTTGGLYDRPIVAPGVLVSGGGQPRFTATEGAGMSGALVLDCEGRVLGLSDAYGSTFTAAADLKALMAERNRQPDYDGQWSAAHFDFGLSVQIDGTKRPRETAHRSYVGLSLGSAVSAYDRLYLPYRFGVYFLPQDPDDGAVTFEPKKKLKSLRLQTDLGIGYRFMLAEGGFFTPYLVPQVGVSFGYEYDTITDIQPVVDVASCAPDGTRCDVTRDTEVTHFDRWYLRPTVGLALQAGPWELSYKLLIDTAQIEASTHQLGLGVHF